MTAIDYDPIATAYDRRYALHDYPRIRLAIHHLIDGIDRPRVLEVGCGTGNWLAELASAGCEVAGVDPSAEMLRIAAARVAADLRRGSAETLPWADGSFDAVIYVNSLHHVASPEAATREAFRVLRPGGRLLSIGLDPHDKGDSWYVYDYFPETLAADLERFHPRDRRTLWLETAGFVDVQVHVAERLQSSTTFEKALEDGVLEPSFTSQLTALSRAHHTAGVEPLREAAQRDQAFRLEVDLKLRGTWARRPNHELTARP